MKFDEECHSDVMSIKPANDYKLRSSVNKLTRLRKELRNKLTVTNK